MAGVTAVRFGFINGFIKQREIRQDMKPHGTADATTGVELDA